LKTNLNSTLQKVVLVTGGTGLLGQAIISELQKDGYTIKATYNKHIPNPEPKQNLSWYHWEISDSSSLNDLLEDVDIVIHTAAIVSFNPDDHQEMFRVNVEGTRLLVDFLLATTRKIRLIHISSIAALGKPHLEGNNEGKIDAYSQWDDQYPHTFYGKTKFLSELEIWRGVQEGLEAVLLNPAVVLAYGESSSAALFKHVAKRNPFYSTAPLNYVDIKDVLVCLKWSLEVTSPKYLNRRYVVCAGQISYQSFFNKLAALWQVAPPPYRLTKWVANIAWRLDLVRSLLTGAKPYVTKELAQNAFRNSIFDGHEIAEIIGFTYRLLDESLVELAEKYRGLVK
jgi:nucleoside-diphosphate-sugar epimerase